MTTPQPQDATNSHTAFLDIEIPSPVSPHQTEGKNAPTGECIGSNGHPGKYTERQMLDLLHLRYAQTNPGNGPRYACAEHVKNQAGFYARRCADFIAVDCWPTGGIELHGHEVKVSRSDWLHELKQPEKAEAFKRYMDRWWLVVPDVKIVKPDELPDGWGLLVVVRRTTRGSWPNYHERRVEMRLRAAVTAPKLEPDPVPKELLATLMRSAVKTTKRRGHEMFCTAPCHHQSWLFA